MEMRIIKNQNMKWWIGVTACTLLFLTIIIFSYIKMGFVFKGVRIVAKLEQKTDSPMTIISGTADKATVLTLNGREIFIDKQGNFSESIAVLPGYSIISLNAKDRFGKTAEKTFEIVREAEAKAVAFKNGQIIN